MSHAQYVTFSQGYSTTYLGHDLPSAMEPQANYAQLGGAEHFSLDAATRVYYELPPIRYTVVTPRIQPASTASTFHGPPGPPGPSGPPEPLVAPIAPTPTSPQSCPSTPPKPVAEASSRNCYERTARRSPPNARTSSTRLPFKVANYQKTQPRHEPYPLSKPHKWSWNQLDHMKLDLCSYQGSAMNRLPTRPPPQHMVNYVRQAMWDGNWVPLREDRPCMTDVLQGCGAKLSKDYKIVLDRDSGSTNDFKMDGVYYFGPEGPCIAFVTQPTMASSNCVQSREGFISKEVYSRYMLGVMIGLAKEQKRQRVSRKEGGSQSGLVSEGCSTGNEGEEGIQEEIEAYFPVNLIVAPGQRDNMIYVYMADISSKLLDQFEAYPAATAGDALTVFYQGFILGDSGLFVSRFCHLVNILKERVQSR